MPKPVTKIMLALLLLGCTTAQAQNNIGFNFIFLTWHPNGDDMAFLQPNRFDPRARFVPNWGGVVHYEHFFYKRFLSVKLAQGAYSDCARLFAGHTHLALRMNVLNGSRHQVRFGFGPTWVYRQNWNRFPGYEQQNLLLKDAGNWQKAFVWYGGELEYDYHINEKGSIGLHIIPGIPDFFTFGIGYRHYLNPVPPSKAWKKNRNAKRWFYNQQDISELVSGF